jgi:hypothetical protein
MAMSALSVAVLLLSTVLENSHARLQNSAMLLGRGIIRYGR